MEWLTEIVKAVLTLAGVFISVRYALKGKKLELASAHDKALEDMQNKHTENLNKAKSEFNTRFDIVGIKLDDIKTEQIKIAMCVTQLQKDLTENNELVKEVNDRVGNLESEVSALKATVASNTSRIERLEERK